MQTLIVRTAPRAHVKITVKFSFRKPLHHTHKAGASGKLTWRFKEPKGGHPGLRVKVSVTARGSNASAHASGHYITG